MRQPTGISQRLPFKTVKNRWGNIFPLIFFSPIAYAIGSQMGLSSQTLFHLRNCPALNSVGFNVLGMTVKSSGVHLDTSLGVR